MNLKGKTALITRASKGIGRSIASLLAQEGVHVGLISRTLEDLQAMSLELSRENDINISMASADISKRNEVESAVDKIQQELGHIDILINNAGIAEFGTVTEMDPETWERIIQVNLMGTYYTTHAVVPRMIERNEGTIVNIASTAGERGFARGSAYCASKFAVIGFTESVMQEVRKHNIRVTALTPSTVNTELAANLGLTNGDDERVMQPADVAELVLAVLKLPKRVFVKTAGIWATNPL